MGYVFSYGYDAFVVVNFVVVEFVRVGVYNRRCHHSCDVERLDVGIASRSVFGLPLRDKFHLDRWKGLIFPEYHSWVFRSKGRVEDGVLNVNDLFGKLVHDLIPFEKYTIPVGKVKNTREGGRRGIRFNFLDDRSGMGYGVNARRLTFFPVARLRNL